MKVISFKSKYGDTVEVMRGPEGEVLVRHSDKDPERFGIFNTVENLTHKPGAWEFLARKGIYTNSETGSEAINALAGIGLLLIDEESLLISPEDGEQIIKAFGELD